MNWLTSQLRNQLTKERLAHESKLNHLITNSKSVRKFKEFQKDKKSLEEQLEQNQQIIANSQQSIVNSQAEINSKEKILKDLKLKLSQIQNLRKEERFNLQKELRAYHLYHQREIRRLAPDLKAKIADLKAQKGQLLKQIQALQILANHRLALLEQEKEALITLAKQKIKNKKEAKELLEQLQANWQEEKANLIAEHQAEKNQLQANIKASANRFNEQLRTINRLFDADSEWYESPIDFTGLYQGLVDQFNLFEKRSREEKAHAEQELALKQASWAQEKQELLSQKQSLIIEHENKLQELANESSEQEQLVAQEIKNLRAKHKADKTKLLKEITQLKAVLQRILTEQEAQLRSLDN